MNKSKFVFLVFVFLFSLSSGAQLEYENEPNLVGDHLRENYGVNSIEEYRFKLERQLWESYTKTVEQCWSNYTIPNHWKQDLGRTYGTLAYQPIPIQNEVYPLWLNLANVNPLAGTIVAISQGTDADAFSYLVYVEGNTYYAINGSTWATDYSGTDASKVIQSAINALGETGGKIFIKNGTYNINSTILLDGKTGVIIEGESKGTKLVNRSLNAHLLRIVNSQRCEVHNLWLYGNKPSGASGLVLDNSSFCTIIDVISENFVHDGFLVVYGSAFNNFIRTIGASNGGSGVYEFSGCRENFYNGYFYDNAENGVAVSTNCYRSAVYRCYIYNNAWSGLIFYRNCWGGMAFGNIVRNNGKEGIIFNSGCNDGMAIGNFVESNDRKGLTLGGIVFWNEPGYSIDGGVVIGNRCNDSGGYQDYGIAIYSDGGGCYNILVVGNDVRGNVIAGILNQVGSNAMIEHNLGYDTEFGREKGQSFLIITTGAVFLAVAILIFALYLKLRRIESDIKQQRK